MGDKIRVMYSEEEVDKRIRELGEQISKRYEGIKGRRIFYV